MARTRDYLRLVRRRYRNYGTLSTERALLKIRKSISADDFFDIITSSGASNSIVLRPSKGDAVGHDYNNSGTRTFSKHKRRPTGETIPKKRIKRPVFGRKSGRANCPLRVRKRIALYFLCVVVVVGVRSSSSRKSTSFLITVFRKKPKRFRRSTTTGASSTANDRHG